MRIRLPPSDHYNSKWNQNLDAVQISIHWNCVHFSSSYQLINKLLLVALVSINKSPHFTLLLQCRPSLIAISQFGFNLNFIFFILNYTTTVMTRIVIIIMIFLSFGDWRRQEGGTQLLLIDYCGREMNKEKVRKLVAIGKHHCFVQCNNNIDLHDTLSILHSF